MKTSPRPTRTRARTPNHRTTTGCRLSDALGAVLAPRLPVRGTTHRFGSGRPRVPDRGCAEAMFSGRRTGCQGAALHQTEWWANGGVKRNWLTEGHGVPLGWVVEGANRHDMHLGRATGHSLVVKRPPPIAEQPPGMCLDKSDDDQEERESVEEVGCTAPIRARGEAAQAI